MITPKTLKVGTRYNWKYQSERLVYMGKTRFGNDPRVWYQFAKVDDPEVVWCEVLDCELHLFEESEPQNV